MRPDELLGEDALLLRKGSMIQIKDQRKDGWAYGTVVLNKGDESKDRRFLEDGISLSAGWFPLGCTDVPSVDQLGELQKLLGGAGDSALDPPKYWGQVKDPLMAEYFPLQQGSEEYQRVYNAINLTTGPQQLRIHSIERVQNISLWQSYCVKKSATVAREKDPVAAERNTCGTGRGTMKNQPVSSLPQPWQTQLRRKYRVDGVGPRNLISTGCSTV